MCHPALQPGTPYCTAATTLLSISATGWSQRGSAQGTGALLPRQQSQHKRSTVMRRSHTRPCRNRHRIQVPKGPAVVPPGDRDAAVQLAQSGQLLEGRGSPSPLAPSKGHGGFNGSLCAAPISFIDLFSMESSN